MAATEGFFEERSDQSEVKSRIVAKFFASWSNVIVNTAKRNGRQPKLAYLDLFSGPGRYTDGAKSTPLLIVEKAIDTPDLANNILTYLPEFCREFRRSGLRSERLI
jgi:three-Cys-motif partner protein